MMVKKHAITANDLLEMLQEGDQIRITIKGNSMLPLVTGDKDLVTLTKATPASVQKGKLVVARVNHDTFYLHRIAKVHGNRVTLRGDGNPYSRETCPTTAILAEAVAVEKNGKTYTNNSIAWKAARYLWPSNGFLRRVLMAFYRRIYK